MVRCQKFFHQWKITSTALTIISLISFSAFAKDQVKKTEETKSANSEALINLDPAQLSVIEFDDIKPTAYSFKDGVLQATVDNSSTALVVAFDKITKVSAVSWEWKADGKTKVQSTEQQKSKKGDDTIWRVGVMLKGEPVSIPFFAPAWIKKLGSTLKHPSEKMIYLTVGSPVPAGGKWESPYSDSLENIALDAKDLGEDGWKSSTWKAKKPLSVVGLWIMSDGDNTNSQFQAWMRWLRVN